MEDLDNLQHSFAEFNRATSRIMKAYGRLEKEFARLNIELEEKNLELEKLVEEKEDVKNYLHNILESLTTGVVVADLEGTIQTANRCAEIFFREPRNRLAGMNLNVFFPEVTCHGWKGILDNDIGIRHVLGDRVLAITGSAMRARTGEILGLTLVLRDITRLERLEEIAKRSEKLAAMGEMAANIAHEIRNPLGSIELFASLLLKESPEERNANRIANIMGAVKNIDNKIANLLFFAGANPPRMESISLAGILRDIIGFIKTITDQAGISLEVEFSPQDPRIFGDAEMLKQVFLNIVLNALQAMPEGGKLSLKTSLAGQNSLRGGDGLYQVAISDTGPGIPADKISRIFEPFFSTKEGNTGLGLAICHSIVSMHRGEIYVTSGTGGGSNFTVALPLGTSAGRD